MSAGRCERAEVRSSAIVNFAPLSIDDGATISLKSDSVSHLGETGFFCSGRGHVKNDAQYAPRPKSTAGIERSMMPRSSIKFQFST